MHNPLRSEADVFRLVVVIGVAAALVVALTLITSAIVGILLVALLVGIGIGFAYRGSRRSEPRHVEATRTTHGTPRILVVSNHLAADGGAAAHDVRAACLSRAGPPGRRPRSPRPDAGRPSRPGTRGSRGRYRRSRRRGRRGGSRGRGRRGRWRGGRRWC